MDMDNSKIFNRELLRKRRNRSAVNWQDVNFLKVEAADRLVDCLKDIARPFSLVLDLGCHSGEVSSLLGNSTVIGCDIAENMKPQVVCDEEFLPFAPDVFDLVASTLSLHHVNDLPGSLVQIREVLKPDGLFIAIVPGANTLMELRQSVTGAAAEHGFMLSPRISPFVEVRDAGALMQRAGFALPVINSEIVTVNYENPYKLLQDLHAMGESNVLLEQSQYFTSRSHIAAICAWYQAHFASSDGSVPASFEFITMTGWKPHISQQKPLQRGSGQVNLKHVLE